MSVGDVTKDLIILKQCKESTYVRYSLLQDGTVWGHKKKVGGCIKWKF
jgi:hypothetical protein